MLRSFLLSHDGVMVYPASLGSFVGTGPQVFEILIGFTSRTSIRLIWKLEQLLEWIISFYWRGPQSEETHSQLNKKRMSCFRMSVGIE